MAKKKPIKKPAEFPPVAKIPFWMKCAACTHCWAAAYLPMEVDAFVRLCKRPRCPMCASDKIEIAKQAAGVLFEKPAKKH